MTGVWASECVIMMFVLGLLNFSQPLRGKHTIGIYKDKILSLGFTHAVISGSPGTLILLVYRSYLKSTGRVVLFDEFLEPVFRTVIHE